ncbi:MAG: electron transfer flavoprotein subunit alpha/FixB family protein [Clostridia bacterium]|nr:electron transfer flavoprotein subunit alpha/FixB family protein [Clostridia bacterium]NCD01816.1 electron transfer flavoprotein subunit alpha/FixB family protein [Clostridia bacterium]
MGCKNVMVYVETAEGKPVNVGLEMLTAAKDIAEKVTAVVIGADAASAAATAISYGADAAITVDAAEYNTEAYAVIIEALAKKYAPEMVFVGGTTNGKDLGARVAAKLKAGCVTDVIGIKEADGKVVLTAPLYGGSIYSDAVVDGSVAVAIVRGGVFKKAEPEEGKQGEVTAETVEVAELKAKIVNAVQEISESVNLEEAEIIVAGGRGMGSAENFELVKELADLLGGVVGATRPAMEDGWVSRAHQVGQSGKIVAPKLYIAAGISGAIQHVSGMIGSDYIVAINKDEDASIFDVANVGIVGNAIDALKIMIEEVKKMKADE